MKTKAELEFDARQKLAEHAKKEGFHTYEQQVHEYNEKLGKQSEHYDMPKIWARLIVSWGYGRIKWIMCFHGRQSKLAFIFGVWYLDLRLGFGGRVGFGGIIAKCERCR